MASQTSPTLPCRARNGLQAVAARTARAMAREFPLSPPALSRPKAGEGVYPLTVAYYQSSCEGA